MSDDAPIWVTARFNCPSCGTTGYEEDFTPSELRGSQVTIPCDDCDSNIHIEIQAGVWAGGASS